MTAQEFKEILIKTLTSCRRVLRAKASEYAKEDRLYNFKRAAECLRQTPEQALLGMMQKHSVSVIDLIEACKDNCIERDSGKILGPIPDKSLINEKIGDSINYLILLKGLLYERYGY
jgi:hypothetical protein